jgi:hypothetical protein
VAGNEIGRRPPPAPQSSPVGFEADAPHYNTARSRDWAVHCLPKGPTWSPELEVVFTAPQLVERGQGIDFTMTTRNLGHRAICLHSSRACRGGGEPCVFMVERDDGLVVWASKPAGTVSLAMLCPFVLLPGEEMRCQERWPESGTATLQPGAYTVTGSWSLQFENPRAPRRDIRQQRVLQVR